MNPKLLSRDQGRLSGLVRWGGKVVAKSTPPRVLDLVNATSTAITVPGLEVVQSVAGDAVRFAGGLQQGALTVLRERGEKWEALPLPTAVLDARGERGVSLFAGGESVVVVWFAFDKSVKPPKYAHGVEWWSGGKWSSVVLENEGQGLPKHVLVSEGRLLVGYSRGEWGGSLWSVSPSGVTSRVDPVGRQPVQGIVPTGGGVVVGTGLAHLGGLTAHVARLSPDGAWETLVHVDAYEPKKSIAWELPPDSLEGLDVDGQGRLHLLTGSHGVLVLENGKLKSVTPGWPAEHLYGEGLIIEGPLAVIGTFDGGVLLWKLGTSDVRRILISR